MDDTLDVVIIGSGTAGLSALREVRKRTDKFLLINEGLWGTTCASVGCMPSKALIEVANAFHRRHDFAAFGLKGAEGVTADIPAVLERVRSLRDDFVKGPQGNDIVVGFEDPVRQPVVAEVLPDVLDRVQFRRTGRERQQGVRFTSIFVRCWGKAVMLDDRQDGSD